MIYRLTALTPTLVGDGRKLAPIDYMVWKEQVNILDQNRIFRLLAKGQRLEGYLTQLRTADKLDFAAWGGFAQNYAERRIPFEHPTATAQWNQSRTEHLHIPTFHSSHQGPFLPATALKGALRTAVASSRWTAETISDVETRMAQQPIRKPGEAAEASVNSKAGGDSMSTVSLSDSEAIDYSAFKVYLTRLSTLLNGASSKYQLAWKSNPAFAEMATPGTSFTGDFRVLQRGRSRISLSTIFNAANQQAKNFLQVQADYAEAAGLELLLANVRKLQESLSGAQSRSSACLLCLGWGGGYLGKVAFQDVNSEIYRNLLRRFPYYDKAIRSGMPFPKTRRIVYQEGQPATFPGWVLLTTD